MVNATSSPLRLKTALQQCATTRRYSTTSFRPDIATTSPHALSEEFSALPCDVPGCLCDKHKYYEDRVRESCKRRRGSLVTTKEEMQLCEFDLHAKFGPCLGLPRLERWHRALRLNLEPPLCILDTLTCLDDDDPAHQSIYDTQLRRQSQ